MRSRKKRVLKNKFKKCAMCGSEKKLTIDHIIPRSKGVTSRWKNLQVLCKKCNSKKGDKIIPPQSYPQHNVAVNNGRDIIISLSANEKNMSETNENIAGGQATAPAPEAAPTPETTPAEGTPAEGAQIAGAAPAEAV